MGFTPINAPAGTLDQRDTAGVLLIDPLDWPRRFQDTMMFFNAPITVLACTYDGARNFSTADGLTARDPAWLQIAFENSASIPVRRVRFVVGSGRERQTVEDVGTFSPSVRIVHAFDATPDVLPDGPQPCSVEGVTFADGSHWTAG